MAPRPSKKMEAVHPPSSAWDNVLGALASLIVFLVPFFPDEKLIRPKMQAMELGVFLLLGAVVLRIFLTSRWPIHVKRESPSFRIVIAISGWISMQTLLFFVSNEKSLAANELRRVILGASAFWAFGLAALNHDWMKRVLVAWGLSAGLLAGYGVLQVSGGVGIIEVPQMDRIMATYGNPIFFAVYLVCSIFVTGAAGSGQKPGLLKKLLLVSLLAQALALYHTQTRAAWVALVVTFFFGILLKSGWKKFPKGLFLLAVVAMGLFAYQTRHVWQRDQGHLLIWRDTLRMWADNPVHGVGLGAFHTRFPSYAQADLKAKWPQGQTIINYAHNEYFQQLAETGVGGTCSFMAVLFFLWLMVRKGLSTDPILLPLFLAAVALLVQNFFSVDMRFGISFASLFILIGLMFSQQLHDHEQWPVPKKAWPAGFRYGGALVWLGFMLLVVFPKIRQPYRAQQKVSTTPGFFNERLLDPAKSIQDLEKLAEQYPNEPQVLEKLAYVYAKEMKTTDDKINSARAEAALAAYERLVQLDPNRVSAYNNMANINYTLGRHTEAIALWKKCVEVDPNFLDAHLNLGKTLYVRGELKESAAHLEKVLELQPGNAEAIVYLKRMVE